MFRRREKHRVPELNTVSTADISFMLLVFFLVTTSMDSDKGLGRRLPPQDPDDQEEVQDVDRTKVMTLCVMAGGKTTLDEREVKIDNALRREIRHFIVVKGARHIIELQVGRSADYDTYFRLQNTIVLAYREIRDAAAQKKYGKRIAECNEEQRESIFEMYPQRIQEVVVPE